MSRPPKNHNSQRFLEILHQIGVNVRSIREDLGLSQAELARRAKVSNTTLNEIETRQYRDIRLSTLASLAQVLDVPVSHLIQGPNLDLSRRDQTQLLKASETLFKVVRRIR